VAAPFVAWVALGASSAAGATEVRLSEEIDEPRFFEPANVAINADRARNSIRVGFDRRRRVFVIRDRVRVKAPQCDRLSRTAVRCSADYDEVYVNAGGGDDRVKIRSTVRASGFLSGQKGADLVVGGRRADEVEGGPGGGDFLGGGADERGHDVFEGGAGEDFCDAKDGRRDVRIDCGTGRGDQATVDRIDPRPRRCENVRRRP
jgi:hypothetical protein